MSGYDPYDNNPFKGKLRDPFGDARADKPVRSESTANADMRKGAEVARGRPPKGDKNKNGR